MAENGQGQRGQRVGVDVTLTCIQGMIYRREYLELSTCNFILS